MNDECDLFIYIFSLWIILDTITISKTTVTEIFFIRESVVVIGTGYFMPWIATFSMIKKLMI